MFWDDWDERDKWDEETGSPPVQFAGNFQPGKFFQEKVPHVKKTLLARASARVLRVLSLEY
jgi:hypothetical protein